MGGGKKCQIYGFEDVVLDWKKHGCALFKILRLKS
jgi:hypothetical protein